MITTLNRPNLNTETRQAPHCGEIYSYTVEENPDGSTHILALVRLDDGSIVTAQLSDVRGNIAIGDRVEMVQRKVTAEGPKGMIVYGYTFRQIPKGA